MKHYVPLLLLAATAAVPLPAQTPAPSLPLTFPPGVSPTGAPPANPSAAQPTVTVVAGDAPPPVPSVSPAPITVSPSIVFPALPKLAKLEAQPTGDLIREPASPLDQKVAKWRSDNEPLARFFGALGRAYKTSFIVDAGVTGTVSIDMQDCTLRDLLRAVTETNDLFTEERGGYISISRNQTVLYLIEYPKLNRTSQGSTSVNLSSGSRGNQTGGLGGSGSAPASTATTGNNANGQGGSSGNGDTTSLTIQQSNDGNFWVEIETEIKGMLRTDEKLVLNRFSGIAALTAAPRRQAELKRYVDFLNERINEQVLIEAQFVEITTDSQKKLGVDWSVAFSRADQLGVRLNAATAATNLTTVGPNTLSPDTFVTNLGVGKATLVIHALEEQGNVKIVSEPKIRTLNNQPAYIIQGTEDVFFSLASSTQITTPGASNAFTTTQDVYSQNPVTIGTVLYVNPMIGPRGITLDILPSVTRLQGVRTSPDNRQTAPTTQQRKMSALVRMKDGETVMIGGLYTTTESSGERSIPFLGKIPGLGKAFRTDVAVTGQTQFVIFLTVKRVRT